MFRQLENTDITWLFNEVWPGMEGAAGHRENCLAALPRLNAIIQANTADPDSALVDLASIPGVKWVIASGLLFASAPKVMVPFDKYTMGWALELGILKSHVISKGKYSDASRRVVAYVERSPWLNEILDFVREASSTQTPFAPE